MIEVIKIECSKCCFGYSNSWNRLLYGPDDESKAILVGQIDSGYYDPFVFCPFCGKAIER